ncbi:MAG: hypothetical protein ACREVJ_09880, partial [Gammaproteobacteria bacterium]
MSQTDARIRDFVEARAQPTVVRLQDLQSEHPEWLSESFILTAEVRAHLEVLSRLLSGGRGSGVFLLGQYGAGKSHLLAYLAQQVSLGRLLPDPPDLVPISLVDSPKAYKRALQENGSLFAAVQDVNQRRCGRHHLHILEKLVVLPPQSLGQPGGGFGIHAIGFVELSNA